MVEPCRLVPNDRFSEQIPVVGDQTTGIAAVLWDLDGTLVDTEPYWMETEFAIAAEHGATWSNELAERLIGNELVASGRFIRDHMRLELTVDQVVDRLLDGVVARVEEHVPWRPGARELLVALADEGVPCALVTMSYQRFVSPILAELPDGIFGVVVTGDVVSRGKPHPEPYLTAAARLGVDPADCIAIEDSNTGCRSAEAAGCTVLGIANHVPLDPGPRRVFRDSLVGLSAAGLAALRLPGDPDLHG